MFKTSTGRKIAPFEIEAQLQHNPIIEHAVVFGATRKFLVALITAGNTPSNVEAMTIVFAQKLATNLAQCVSNLPKYKRPVGVVLCFKNFSVEQQELTANLKIRRKAIQQRYGIWIEKLYNELNDPQSIIHRQHLLVDPGIVLFKL